MTYRAVGAGPGPVKTYKVDMPFPWGANTEITVPVQAMVDDTWAALQPKVDALITQAEEEVSSYAPDEVRTVMNSVVIPKIQSQMEEAFAEMDMMKDDALKAVLGVTGILVIAIGLSAWWVKRG